MTYLYTNHFSKLRLQIFFSLVFLLQLESDGEPAVPAGGRGDVDDVIIHALEDEDAEVGVQVGVEPDGILRLPRVLQVGGGEGV